MIDLERATAFVWSNGRLLERAMLAQTLGLEPPGRVIAALSAYQNPDGGFGHGLEADVCAPESQPLFVEFALTQLHDWDLRVPDLALSVCAFLERHVDLERGIVTLFPSALNAAHAAHWDNPSALEPSLDRMVGIVGLLNWQGTQHPWLAAAVDACMERIETLEADDAHTLAGAFVLLESVAGARDISRSASRLADLLSRARFLIRDAPVVGYGLTPLNLAPRPDAFCRPLFTDAQYAGHLDDLESRQQSDGGWPIAWEPPGEATRCTWRAHVTVRAVATLRAWGRA